jgi:microcystin-dependent protein
MNPFVGQILMVGFNFAPIGWALCNGQLLPIAQNTALFSLLGTYYGGDGIRNFALPNLQGRVPIHQGSVAGGSNYVIGASGGVEHVTLQVNNLPAHTHPANCSSKQSSSASPVNHFWAEAHSYGAASDSQMAPTAVGSTGGGQPITVVQPYLCVNFIIALEGVYPSRS